MSLDRLVYFDDEAPTKKQIGEVLTDFLGELATSVEWKTDRWYATLVGKQSHMFQRQSERVARRAEYDRGRERWIEVWLKGKTMDVMTRQADDATNALAAEFAARCARYWNGRLEDA